MPFFRSPPSRQNRREFLRGAGGIAIALPLLTSLGGREAHAARRRGAGMTRAQGAPKRFVIFYSANGTIRDAWVPQGEGADFTLGPILEPLAPHKADILVLNGIAHTSAKSQGGNGHAKGMAHMLTCTKMIPEEALNTGFGSIGYAGGPSIDQAIAKEIGKDTTFTSLEFGVHAAKQYGSHPYSRMTYAAAQQPIPCEDNPVEAFDRIFGDLGVDPLELETIRAQRRSVLDFVKEDFERVRDRAGVDDRVRLDQHLEQIRAIEKQLENHSGGAYGDACTLPETDLIADYYGKNTFPQVGKAQMDLLVMALACDLTRVASLQWSSAQSGMSHSWLGISEGHHSISHGGNMDTVARDKLVAINRWYAEQFAYLIGQMKAVPEGDGTMLDNTAILWVSEIGKGNNHSQDNIPYVLAGRAGGAIASGRHLVYGGERSTSDLFVGLMQAMDVNRDTFGDPQWVNGPLPGLAG